MPKDQKYESPNPRRTHTIMSPEDYNSGKKSSWHELELTGKINTFCPEIWNMHHLTALYANENNLHFIPPFINRLVHLTYLDLSHNKLRNLPPEIGDLSSLRELLLNHNIIRSLPLELGKLFQLQTLGLQGNPLNRDLATLYNESEGTSKLLRYLLDQLPINTSAPPARNWLTVQPPSTGNNILAAPNFTVMCYNVLCDKYCTKQMYAYCPSWALNWEFRKKGIMDEIRGWNADIISLQEVETDQYYTFFAPELKRNGYSGIFSPKSRARTMTEMDRKHVDGCAIFYRNDKFQLMGEHLIEFNQLAMANAQGSDEMLNRVMTKDNIGLAAVLQTKEGFFEHGSGAHLSDSAKRQVLLVATAHIHWDPEFSDVKLIQTMMLMAELKRIVEETSQQYSLKPSDPNAIPLILCGDLNSLPDSGVIEFLTSGKVSPNHEDFRMLGYENCLQKLNPSNDKMLTHGFRIKRSYTEEIMPHTNYTYDFKGIIDYIFFSSDHLTLLGVLGAIEESWFVESKVLGCPHPHVPSDHFPLLVQLELPIRRSR